MTWILGSLWLINVEYEKKDSSGGVNEKGNSTSSRQGLEVDCVAKPHKILGILG